MKPYRAIVIDGKKIIRRGLQVVIMIIVTSLVLINVKIADVQWTAPDGRQIISDSIPAIRQDDDGGWLTFSGILKKFLSFVMTFDPYDGRTVLFGELPVIRAVSGGYLARVANENLYNGPNVDKNEKNLESSKQKSEQYPIKEVDSSQAKALGKNSGKILIRNETTYSINVAEMLNSPLTFDMKGDEPKILIVHTHGTESYSPEGAEVYQADKSDRSLDKSQNMVKVGESMKQIFEERGISVVHDTTLHDHPDFNGSYENSRKTIEKYLSKYPSICIVLDIHRDAFIYDDGSKAKFVTEIDGKKVAQLMFVVGTDAGGLNHPKWRENMKLALKLQNHINDRHSTLMRGVNLRTERFNGHTTCGSMIIEVGSSGNTLAEAIDGAQYGAAAIADFLNTLK